MTGDPAFTSIPMRWVGPLRLSGDVVGEQQVPLATYETPLWPSVGRGARISRLVASWPIPARYAFVLLW